MMIEHGAGRYDHLHGDEDYQDQSPQTIEDVMALIANGGQFSYDWIKQLAETDALYHLLVIVCKGRNNPHYAPLVEAIKDEIRGYI